MRYFATFWNLNAIFCNFLESNCNFSKNKRMKKLALVMTAFHLLALYSTNGVSNSYIHMLRRGLINNLLL